MKSVVLVSHVLICSSLLLGCATNYKGETEREPAQQPLADDRNVSDQLDEIIAKSNYKKAPDLCEGVDSKLEDSMRVTSNSLWQSVLRNINEGSVNAKIVNVNNETKNVNFGLNYTVLSRYYAPGVHSGTDQFEFSLGLAFPYDKDVSTSLGFNEKRVASFTRLYNSKCLSIVRVPYNPIKRLPVTAAKAAALTEGELVTFSAPITVSFGVGLDKEFAKGSVGTFRTADVEVNVFRMQGNYVRLKLIAKKEKGVNFSMNVGKDMLLGPVRILRAEGGKTNTDLNLMDYIFDLSDAEARKVYESIVASKNILTFDTSDEKTKALTAVLGNRRDAKSLLLDVAEIYKNAKDNKNIIRVLNSESEMSNTNSGFSVNLLNVARLENKAVYSDSNTSVMSEDQKVLHSFFSRSIETIQSSKFFSLTAKDKYAMGTIYFSQSDGEPIGFLLQRHSNRQDLSDASKSRLAYRLANSPLSASYSNKAEKLTEIQKGGKLHIREMFFVDAEKVFGMNKALTIENVRQAVLKIMNNFADNNLMFTSTPAVESYEGSDKLIERHNQFLTFPDKYTSLSKSKKMAELTWIYSNEINTIIPNYLARITDQSASRDERSLAFNALMQTPLFNEIGIELVVSLIPQDKLKDTVIYELLLQPGNDTIEPMYITYGDTTGKNYITSQNAILTRNFSLEPASNLSVYLKPDGQLKTVKEVLDSVTMKDRKN